METRRKRRVGLAVAVFGAFVLAVVALVGAYAVVDMRAAEAINHPQIFRAAAKPRASADPRRMTKLLKRLSSAHGTPATTMATFARAGTVGSGAASAHTGPGIRNHFHHRRRHHRR